MDNPQEKTYFCYLFFYTIYDACVGLGIAALTILILCYSISQYYRTLKINMLSKNVKLIYIGIFMWSIAYFLKLCFGQVLFFMQNSNQDPTFLQYQTFQAITRYLFALDLTGVFIFQAILVLVIYNWMSNIVAIFSQISHMEEQDDPEYKNSLKSFLRFEIGCQKLLKVYLIARFLFFGLLIVFLAKATSQTDDVLTKTMLILLLAEACCVVIILTLGMVSVKTNVKLAEIVNENQIRKMLVKYAILLLFALTRAVVDSVFVSLNFQTLAKKSKCYIDFPEKVGLNLPNVIFQGLFTHCLPILLVLRIYRVQDTAVDLTQSLLAAEEYSGSADNFETGRNK